MPARVSIPRLIYSRPQLLGRVHRGFRVAQ